MSIYSYTSISNLVNRNDATFYGIITDATFPNKEEGEDVYSCTLKVIDHTVNHITNPLDIQNHQVYVTFKSDQIEFLPFVYHVGDIIRVHRALYVPKLKKNVYCNLESNGPLRASWCIFAASSNPNSKSFEPISCSSRTYTFEDVDFHIITNLRHWVKNYLKERGSLVYPKTLKLIDRNKDSASNNIDNFEKDLIVQVCYKAKNGNDTISLWVQDDTDGCEMVVYNIFNYIEVGDVIRVRSFKTYKGNIVVLNSFSNLIKIPSFSQLYETFAYKILSKKTKFKLDIPVETTTQKIEERRALVTLSNNEDYSQYPLRKINEIRIEDTKFLMDVYLINCITPYNNFVNYYEESSKKNFEDAKKSGKNSKAYYNVQFVISDEEFGSSTLKLYLTTHDGQGEGFLGFSASEYTKNEKKVKDLIKKMEDQSNYCQVLVEAIQVGTEIGDKIYRIIGKYKTK